jgi:hypothetical protein
VAIVHTFPHENKKKGNKDGEITLNVVLQLLLCGNSNNMQENMIENVVVAFFNDLHVDGWSRTVTDGRRSRLETVYTYMSIEDLSLVTSLVTDIVNIFHTRLDTPTTVYKMK